MEGKLKNRLFTLKREYEMKNNTSISQKELAEKAGVSESVIRRWLRNEVRRFDAAVIEGLCRVLECKVGDLLYLEPTP